MTTDNTSGDIEMNETDRDILDQWEHIHGESDTDDMTTLAKAKENYLGYFEDPDDFVHHEIDKHGWFEGVHSLVTDHVDLEALGRQLGYCAQGYYGADNSASHYFKVQP